VEFSVVGADRLGSRGAAVYRPVLLIRICGFSTLFGVKTPKRLGPSRRGIIKIIVIEVVSDV
jgi:hypothetical protein